MDALRDRRGFTLLELVLVVLILGLLASVAAVSLRQPIAETRASLDARTLALTDQRVREQTRREGGPLRLIFDLDRQRLMQMASGRRVREVPLRMRGLYVEHRQYDSGQTEVRYRSDGSSEDYAVQFGETKWLLVAGGTGYVQDVQSEEDVVAILSIAAGDDAR